MAGIASQASGAVSLWASPACIYTAISTIAVGAEFNDVPQPCRLQVHLHDQRSLRVVGVGENRVHDPVTLFLIMRSMMTPHRSFDGVGGARSTNVVAKRGPL
jgi:hypothetical protein